MKSEVKQFISILEKQLTELDARDFDLDAWKKGAIARLSSIYPENSYHLQQLRDIKIDYSSWALRDSNADYKPIDSSKKVGKTIIEAAIDDLKVFGLPKKHNAIDHSELSSKVEKGKRQDFEKLMKNPGDKAFHKHLMELSKRELSDLIVVLMSQEEE